MSDRTQEALCVVLEAAASWANELDSYIAPASVEYGDEESAAAQIAHAQAIREAMELLRPNAPATKRVRVQWTEECRYEADIELPIDTVLHDPETGKPIEAVFYQPIHDQVGDWGSALLEQNTLTVHSAEEIEEEA